ncbi:Flavonoid 3',5'-hydroxylase [Senna tora]|uniref:Flavonoid 3',5'-hydroxylase n=1 Tax=Senna tora TaxID=362788 RepID=A0A834WWE7_9FABA|nr:Flavonoid 3',5'-hydroxylase [Senna tora]
MSPDEGIGHKQELCISIIIFFISYFSIRFLLHHLLLSPKHHNSKKLPPGPKGWPILGSLPLLGNMPHVTLTNLAQQKYGPIMFLKMGTCDTVVASTPQAAKAFLKTLDLNFSNRPTIAGSTHLGYNSQDMVFASYGPKWKLLRRLTNHHMLGNKALEEWSSVRQKEVKQMVKEINKNGISNEEVRISEFLSCAITNMVSQVVLSRRIFEKEGSGSKEFKDMVVEFMVISGVNIGDFVPSVSWMDLQGTDTSGSIIEWALTEMLRNPTILQKAQKEIDQLIGKERLLLESDLPNLPYLQAICKETYRLHPSTPLSVPRVASQACEVDGYYIPKDTRLNVNIWAIGRDPNVWDNPLEFNPERFISGKSAKVSPNGIDFELIPFGGGRRVCVGYRMAMVVIEHVLGTLVHSFDWKLPDGVKEINMDEAFGITLQKAEPLATLVSPRLSSHVYA